MLRLLRSAKHLFFAAAAAQQGALADPRMGVPTHTHDGSSGRLRPRYPRGANVAVRWPGPLDDPVPRGTHRVAC